MNNKKENFEKIVEVSIQLEIEDDDRYEKD